jgi:hypothetical protein
MEMLLQNVSAWMRLQVAVMIHVKVWDAGHFVKKGV